MIEELVNVNEMLIKALAEITNNQGLESAIELNKQVKEKIAMKKDLNSNANAWCGRW